MISMCLDKGQTKFKSFTSILLPTPERGQWEEGLITTRAPFKADAGIP